MTETPPEEGEDCTSLPIPDEQLNKYIGDTVNDFPEFFSPSQSLPGLGSDSEGVIENLLENGDQIMKDLIFKKISDSFLKPRDFPGEKRLDMKLPNLSSSKSAYSSLLDKLFIQKNSALGFSLTYEGASSPIAQYSLLASVIFTDPIYANIPVKVCLNHRDSSKGDLADHFLKIECFRQETRYFTAQRDINMLRIENLPNISAPNHRQETPMKMVFTDFSSCIGGVNRRDICVVFCLEEKLGDRSEIVSTKVLHVKVCENAKRDMKNQERLKERKPKVVVQSSERSNRQGKTEPGQFWVLATSKRNYEALLSVGAVMEGNAGGDVEAWRKEVDNFNNKKPKIELDDD